MYKSETIFLSIAFLCILVFSSLSPSFLPFAQALSPDNVQITIQTSNIQVGYFVVDAFNMSGYLEASTQTHYAAASFELPNGQYIFTVSANNQSYYPVPLMGASSSGQSSPSVSSLPIYVAPAVEYGYSVQHVSSSIAITITTQSVTQFPTNPLSVTVSYANGTAAAGAYVSASVLGAWYYWGYESSVVTWAQTGADGVATVVVPTAPVLVDAWSWVSYKGTNYPTPQTGAPSQVANGTIIPVPIYLGLAGSTLVIPPQTTASIILQPQQPNYWVTPSVGSATPSLSSSSSTYAAGPGSVPYSVYEQQQGNPNFQSLGVPVSTASPQPTSSSSPLTQTATPSSSPSSSASSTPKIPEFPSIIIALTILLATCVTTLLWVQKSKTHHKRRR